MLRVLHHMTRSFHHDGARYTLGDCATVNGLRRVQWEQRRLMSGAYVLTARAWLPTRSTRRDIIQTFSEII
jgi:hypothetical protein